MQYPWIRTNRPHELQRNELGEYSCYLSRQTWAQFKIKSSMGLFHGMRSLRVRFHLAFWRPLKATGGKVYFGPYAEYDAREVPD